MKIVDYHHPREHVLSEGYEALLQKLPAELAEIASTYISNFMDAMMASPLDIAAHWSHMISLTLFSPLLPHDQRRTIHQLYNLTMRDLARAELEAHEKTKPKGHHSRHVEGLTQHVGLLVSQNVE